MLQSALLYCVDIKKPHFKALRARDQLPFNLEPSKGTWQEFSLEDAFRLRLMLDLIGGDGGGQSGGAGPAYAQKVVFNALTKTSKSDILSSQNGIWIGVAFFEESLAVDEFLRFSNWYAGEIEDLPKWIAEREPGCRRVRLMLADATGAARFVVKRAKEANLPEVAAFIEGDK